MSKLLRWPEAAKLSGIHQRTLKRYASASAFRIYRPTCRLTLIDAESLLSWIKRNSFGPTEE